MKYSNEQLSNILEKINDYKDKKIPLEYLIQDLNYLIKFLRMRDKKTLIEIQGELSTLEMLYFYALLEMQRNKEEDFHKNDLEQIDKSLDSILRIINFALNIE